MQTLYQTAATATHEGRNGRVRTEDGLLDLTLAMPRELGGAGGATNPEQLFAAGYAACFTSALLLVARQARAAIGSPAVTVHVALGREGEAFRIGARVEVALPEADRATAEDLTARAHAVCPYSRALGGEADVAVRVTRWLGSGAAGPA